MVYGKRIVNSEPMFKFERYPAAWQDQQGFGRRALRLGLGGAFGGLLAMMGVLRAGRPNWYLGSLWLAPYAWILAFGNELKPHQLAAIPASYAYTQMMGDTADPIAQSVFVACAIGLAIISPVAN